MDLLGFYRDSIGIYWDLLGFKWDSLGFTWDLSGFKWDLLGFNMEQAAGAHPGIDGLRFRARRHRCQMTPCIWCGYPKMQTTVGQLVGNWDVLGFNWDSIGM